MTKYVVILTFLISTVAFAQPINTKKGNAVKGYDVVSYFDNAPVEGKQQFSTVHQGGTYKFSNKKNLVAFKSNPERYLPEYGGFCAYAIATTGKKVDINPKSFQIKDGKLYLFYDSIFADTLEK